MLGGVVLAAGKSTRFKSKKPKVLYNILGKPMAWYVCKALEDVVEKLLMVVGFEKEKVKSVFLSLVDGFIFQEHQLGTGHAVMCALPYLKEYGIKRCIVVNGDMPLVTKDIFKKFIKGCIELEADIGVITTFLEDPAGYGRVVRDENGRVKGIVEDRDITDKGLKRVNEVNAGIYYFNLLKIENLFKELSNNNVQGEYYLTDILKIGYQQGFNVLGITIKEENLLLGANNPKELVRCESILQTKINSNLENNGVVLRNSELIKIGPEVTIDSGVELSGPLEIYGTSRIGEGTCIEGNVVIKDCIIGRDCLIRSFSYLEGGKIGDRCIVGPFSRIRPGTVLEDEARIGNFVEVKKSHIGKGVKANHLAYLGDATVGEGANIGAGTITCNYDGYKKHSTFIGKKAFIGSNTSLVAPVKIGDFSVVGAGSTITKDVPERMLAVARARQKVLKYKKLKEE